MTKIHIEMQKLTKDKHGRPHKSEFKKWFEVILQVLADSPWQDRMPQLEPIEMTVRIIDEAESSKLNARTRNISKPTNVLSFPFESPQEELDNYLGDIAMCGPVIENESKQNRMDIKERWAHMYIHSCLHLLGFSHDNDDSAEEMESMENLIMQKLGYKCAYPELQSR